jgi:uncharacterized membrane protein
MIFVGRLRNMRAWVVPAFYAITALAAGIALPRLELRFLPNVGAGVSSASAMAIYSAVASGMLSLTGIVFSLTFLMVQFSASTFSPRLAHWLAQSPRISHSLGIFIATFIYSITAMAWIDRTPGVRVPLLSAWLVVALLMASMTAFIALMERVGLMQVDRLLMFTAEQGRNVIETLYDPLSSSAPPDEALPAGRVTQKIVYRGIPRALQVIERERLIELASEHDAVIEVLVSVGDVLVELTPMLHVIGGRTMIPQKALLGAIELGDQRTFEQDPQYAIRVLVDIAIRALSPAVNDPTTGCQALSHIQDLLVRLGLRRIETGTLHDAQGTVRLILPSLVWEDVLRLSLDEIRFYGSTSIQVMRRLRALVSDLLSVLPAERHAALLHWERRLQDTAARAFPEEDVEDALVIDHQGLGSGRRRKTVPELPVEGQASR